MICFLPSSSNFFGKFFSIFKICLKTSTVLNIVAGAFAIFVTLFITAFIIFTEEKGSKPSAERASLACAGSFSHLPGSSSICLGSCSIFFAASVITSTKYFQTSKTSRKLGFTFSFLNLI